MNLKDVLLHPNEFDGNSVAYPWAWLLPSDTSVLHVTVLGNLVLANADGRVWLLDSWAGELHGMSQTFEDYKNSVGSDEKFFRSWFLVDLLEDLKEANLLRQPGHVFAPFVSPGLGGSLSPQNFSTAPLSAYIATSAAEAQAVQRHALRGAST